jgi:hypothetical protein
MLTGPGYVRLQGKTGSSAQTAKVTRLDSKRGPDERSDIRGFNRLSIPTTRQVLLE